MFTTSSVKTTPRAGGRPSTSSSPKMACSTTPAGAPTVAATRSIASRARSGPRTLTFAISPLPSPRKWATAGGSNGYRAALVRRQRTPGRISSSPGTAGLPPCISFSTSSPKLSAMPNGMAARYGTCLSVTMSQSKRVLVTGATGKQGGAVVEAFVTRGHHVRALTRNAASPAAQRLREQGVEIAGGDFTDHDSLVRAARGVDAVYAMSTPYEHLTFR